MLPPIPRQMLKSTILVEACTAVDRDRRQVWNAYTVKRVHLQPEHSVRKSKDNTDVVLKAMLFVDARLSTPSLDWEALFLTAQRAGGDVTVAVRGQRYTVASVEGIPDDEDNLHHWEIGLV